MSVVNVNTLKKAYIENDAEYAKRVAEDKGKIDNFIKIPIYYNFDEERGYYLCEDDVRNEFENELEEVEDDLSELNHVRQEHLQTKHAEWDNPPANYEGEK